MRAERIPKMELREEILEKMIDKAAQLFAKNAAELSENTDFTIDLSAKSVDLVKIIAVLEDEFGLDINFMEFRRKTRFGDAAEYVAGLM